MKEEREGPWFRRSWKVVRGRGLGRSVAEGWGAAVARVRDESGGRRGMEVRGGECRQRILGALVGIRMKVRALNSGKIVQLLGLDFGKKKGWVVTE